MGTTLTGTTPQDTYDSLIKVTDNGPLSGTLKALSDGLGNDSTLSLSTTAASIAGTLSVTGNATFDTNTLFVDAANNRVGVGTTAPADALHLTSGNMRITSGTALVTPNTAIGSIRTFAGSSNQFETASITFNTQDFVNRGEILFNTALDSGNTERMRITATGVVQLAQGQIQFPATQVASADPNTLDDYEEGTWTPVFTMGISGTITMDAVVGRYTKVGNLVTCTGFANVASVLLPIGELQLGGLPFVVGAAGDSAASLYIYSFGNTTAVSAYQAFTTPSLSYASIRGYNNGAQITDIGANVVGGAGAIFTITYRV